MHWVFSLWHLEAEYGCKYYAYVEGRLREVYLIAAIYDMYCERDLPQYILRAAGLEGEVRVNMLLTDNDDSGSFHDYTIDTILAESVEDYYNEKFLKMHHVYVKAGEQPSEYIREYFPEGFDFTGYKCKDGKIYREIYKVNQWRFDKNGLITDIDLSSLYLTYQECFEKHPELSPITFDDEDDE